MRSCHQVKSLRLQQLCMMALPLQIAKNKPYAMAAYSFAIAAISMLVSRAVFPADAGIATIFMITVSMMPLLSKAFESEEEETVSEGGLLENHEDVLLLYSMFFLGTFLAFFISFLLTPDATVFFSDQLNAVRSSRISGAVVGGTGFASIALNNATVAILSFVLSVLFGAGAAFILSWNASVVAAYAGVAARAGPAALLQATVGMTLHGIPEIMAYFITGLAGGVLSTSISRGRPGTPEFKRVIFDSAQLLCIALVLIIVAAAIEAL